MIALIGGEVMEGIQFGIVILILILIFAAIIGVWIKVANKIGEKLRIGGFFLNLYRKAWRGNK